VVRRAKAAGRAYAPVRLALEGLEFDARLREVHLGDGSTHKLTPLEARLLEALLLNAGQVLTSDELISDVWGAGGGSTEMLRQLVRRLRAKIETDPAHPQYIENLPGLGYSIGLKR
jgi:DNA-binding response OmpR family regulator